MSSRRVPVLSIFWSLILVAAAAASLYITHEFVVKPRRAMLAQIDEQKKTIIGLEQVNARLNVYLKLLKQFERRARIEVLRREPAAKGAPALTTMRITEIDDAGKPMSEAKEMTLPGREFYFDTLLIKFEDHFVEANDPLKGRALMIFRRVYSDTVKPEEGVVLDPVGRSPEVYAEKGTVSEFEKDLWRQFWELANNEELAKQKGIRAVHGDAPYMRLEPGKVYELQLRTTGEVSITPGISITRTRTPAAK